MTADPDWYEHLKAIPNQEDAADLVYKKINEVLDERIALHRTVFAEEGTQDFDAIKFVIATKYIQTNVDPGMIAALAIAGIYRLARQGNP